MNMIDAAPESERDEQATDTAETPQNAPEADATTEPTSDAPEPDLVRALRAESRGRKDKIRTLETRNAEMETELSDLRAYRLGIEVQKLNAGRPRRLADVSDLHTFTPDADLLDSDGVPDAAKITAALDGLVEAKPHLVQRTSGWDSGIRGSTIPPPLPSLGGLVGRAARGED